MRLYYHNDEDTVYYDFEISEYSLRLNLFENNYLKGLAWSEDSAYVEGDKLLYVMGGGVFRLKMNFSNLDSLDHSIGPDRSVQKADLVLKVDEDVSDGVLSYSDRFNPIPSDLYMISEKSDASTLISVAEYDVSKKEYRFNLTNTIQDILNLYSGMGSTGVYNTLEDLTSFYIIPANSAESVEGVVLKGAEGDETSSRLIVTYSH